MGCARYHNIVVSVNPALHNVLNKDFVKILYKIFVKRFVFVDLPLCVVKRFHMVRNFVYLPQFFPTNGYTVLNKRLGFNKRESVPLHCGGVVGVFNIKSKLETFQNVIRNISRK